jgi:hypothetical protein
MRIFLGSASFIFDEEVMEGITGVARYRGEFEEAT